MYTGQKTFFHFTGPWDRYFADFGCPNIRIHLSKENKMLPKQILTLRPVGSPMQLVLLIGDQRFTPGCKPGPQDM